MIDGIGRRQSYSQNEIYIEPLAAVPCGVQTF
jgi:hypothetical protein